MSIITHYVYGQMPSGLIFQNYDTQNGLSDYSVTSLIKAENGFIWLGTQNGIDRYDGIEFESLADMLSNYNFISDNSVTAIYEDDRGNVWIGTRDGGVNILDMHSSVIIKVGNYLRKLNIDDVGVVNSFAQIDDVIFVGTDNGLVEIECLYDTDGSIIDIRLKHHVENEYNKISALMTVDNILWLGIYNGLIRFDVALNHRDIYHIDSLYNIGDVQAIVYNDPGELLIGTSESGLWIFDHTVKAFNKLSVNPIFDESNIYSIAQQKNRFIWIATWGQGLWVYDKIEHEHRHYFNDPDNPKSLSHDRVYDILITLDESEIWVATWNGLNRAYEEDKVFNSIRRNAALVNTISDNQIRSILRDSNGDLWLGTVSHGLNVWLQREGEYVHHDINNSALESNQVNAIIESMDSKVWVGTSSGLVYKHLGNNEYSEFERYNPLSGVHVVSLYEDSIGNIWVGTWKRGAYKLLKHDLSVIHFNTESKLNNEHVLSENYVWPIFEDSNMDIWMGTIGGGVNRFLAGADSIRYYSSLRGGDNNLSNDRITDIEEYPPGTIWIGTQGGGLNMLNIDSGGITVLDNRDGLPSNNISCMMVDKYGYMWISTSNGLSKMNIEKIEFSNFDARDRLPGDAFFIGSCQQSDDGEFLFGGTNGIISFFPSYLNRQDTIPPNVVLTKLTINDEEIYPGEDQPIDKSIMYADHITLTQEQNNFSIDFAALHFKRPWRHEYRYMLEGEDDDWRTPGELRRASYQNLDDGEYTFKVKAANSDGYWNETGASVEITIEPYWYDTWWAWIVWIVSAGLGIFGLVRWRVRTVEKRAEELEHTVEERTAEINEQNLKLEEQAHQLLEMDRVKSSFFANISHEFRTPLTLILGPVRDALDGAHGPLKDSFQQHLRLVERSGESLKQLIDQLLDLAKLEAGHMHLHARRYDVAPFIQDLIQAFNTVAEHRGVELLFEAEEEELILNFDHDKLERVLNNLLSNALKFTPEGGSITVEASTLRDNEERWVEIVVIDTGIGISEEALPYIFDRFRQADETSTRQHEGAGIGLALTKELVELHGGSIGVVSEMGKGTTFTVRLPASLDGSGEDTDMGVDEPRHELQRHRPAMYAGLELDDVTQEQAPADAPKVLIVEDHRDVRAYVRGFVASRYNVFEAENGREGLKLAHEVKPDLIISDVMMPEMDGYELCSAVKNDDTLNHIPVILLTAKASDEAKYEGLRTGADDYIVKPFKGTDLVLRAENLIEVRRALRRRFSQEVTLGPSQIEVTSEDARFIERVNELIEARLSEISVEDLAYEIGLSPKQLNRKLQGLVEMSGIGYITYMRLQRAAQLLEQHAGRVSEIAYQVGYEDANYFTRRFRQAFGVSPREYEEGGRG